MDTATSRYQTPEASPLLVNRPVDAARPSTVAHPTLCLRCGGRLGHTPRRLVSFDWGAVAPVNSRR